MTPSPPLYILCIGVYCILINTGKGEGSWPERRLEGQQFTWLENSNITDCITSLLTLINTCRKVPLQVNIFWWRHLALMSILLINPGRLTHFPLKGLWNYTTELKRLWTSLKSYPIWFCCNKYFIVRHKIIPLQLGTVMYSKCRDPSWSMNTLSAWKHTSS